MAVVELLLLLADCAVGSYVSPEKASIPRAPVVDSMPRAPVRNLTVFVIPHSHDDTGWQRTVDQYYEEEVRYIYATVVESLLKNSDRRFIFVETAYFMRWWREQDASTQNSVRMLFANGQLEFVNGAWCMADDASPAMDAEIDQVTLGHRYIADVLPGVVPKYAWHIDPFGLSASFAVWWKQMNYSGWVFNRVDTRLKDLWHNETHLQFKWKPANAGLNEGLFAHVLDTHYGSPEITYKNQNYHFDFEVFSGLGGGSMPDGQIPVSTRDPSPFYNHTAEDVAEAFVALVRIRAAWYKMGPPWQHVGSDEGVLLVPFGDDMKFQNAEKQYSNMDTLIRTINANKTNGVTVKYGTISDYMSYINRDAPWPSFDGDFMPLGTNNNIYSTQITKAGPTEYWTGHYTTRPLMKGLVAKANGAKHTSEVAASLACAVAKGRADSLCDTVPDRDLMLARDVTSVLQHHDNIPGTSTTDAGSNLDTRLYASLRSSGKVMAKAANALSGRTALMASSAIGGEIPAISPGKAVSVTFWNSLVQARVEFVTLNLTSTATHVTVTDSATGANVMASVVPALPKGERSTGIPMSSAVPTIVFRVVIAPLSHVTYEIKTTAASPHAMPQWHCTTPNDSQSDITISGDGVTATFAGTTGRLISVTDRVGKTSFKLAQKFFEWHSKSTGNPSSNNYQFQPDRSKFPFGEPLGSKSSTGTRICVLKTEILERTVQIISVDMNNSVDCSSEHSCHETCGQNGGFNTGCGMYYCCNDHIRCNGQHKCGSLYDCACTNASIPVPNITRMLEETTTLYSGMRTTAIGTVDSAAVLHTQTEFSMVHKDRELVTRYSTDLDNLICEPTKWNSTCVEKLPVFETDSNGMLMMRRVVNRTQWAPTPADAAYFEYKSNPIPANYYPLASPGAIRFSDETDDRGVALVTDRAHGATMLSKGQFEVMLGRRCAESGGITDDDTDHIIAKNWIVAGSTASAMKAAHRWLSLRIAAPLIPVITSDTMSENGPPLSAPEPLPRNVHLLSLDRVGLDTSTTELAGRVHLRLHHIFQQKEHPVLSQAAQVYLNQILPAPVKLSNVIELPLNGIGQPTPVDISRPVDLSPLGTRTFEVTLST